MVGCSGVGSSGTTGTTELGTTGVGSSRTTGLVKSLKMQAAHTDNRGGWAKLETSLKRLGPTLMASCCTFMIPRNTDAVSMTAEDSGVEKETLEWQPCQDENLEWQP